MDRDFPYENVVVIYLLDHGEKNRPKLLLAQDTFFSYKNIEELVELAGQVEATYEYGLGNKHRKMIKIPAARTGVKNIRARPTNEKMMDMYA